MYIRIFKVCGGEFLNLLLLLFLLLVMFRKAIRGHYLWFFFFRTWLLLLSPCASASSPSSSEIDLNFIIISSFILQLDHLFSSSLPLFFPCFSNPPCCLPCYWHRVRTIAAATVLLSPHLRRRQEKVGPSVPPARPPFLYSSTFFPLAACRHCCCSTRPSVELHLQAPFLS